MPNGAIGYRDEFTAEELEGKHIDGLTGLVFETEEEYLDHMNPETGYTPRDVAHQDALTGGQFSRVSESALHRGEERINEEMHPAEEFAAAEGVPLDAVEG